MALTKINTRSLSGSLIAGQVPALTGSGLPVGSAIQVIHQSADTSGNSASTTSSAFSTAFQASITPTSASNKILCIVSCSIADTRSGDQLAVGHRMVRQIASGSDTQISSAKTAYSNTEFITLHLRYINSPAAAKMVQEQTFNILDSPNTTSVCNYKIQHKAGTSCTTSSCFMLYFIVTN